MLNLAGLSLFTAIAILSGRAAEGGSEVAIMFVALALMGMGACLPGSIATIWNANMLTLKAPEKSGSYAHQVGSSDWGWTK